MNSLISKYIRKWFQIPISGNISHLKFPKSQLGIGFCSISNIYNQCKITVRRILRTSVNPVSDIQQLYTITSPKNIVADDIIERVATGITKQYQLKKENLVRKTRFWRRKTLLKSGQTLLT